MTDYQGTWAGAVEDTYIRDRTGCVWRICLIDTDGYRRCKNAAGELLTLDPQDPDCQVTMVSHDDQDACISLLRDRLGALLAGHLPMSGTVWTVEPWPSTATGKLDIYRDHLYEFHHMWPRDMKTYAKLRSAHLAAHDPEQPNVGARAINHQHPQEES